jgi:hypothetical protein
MGGNWADRTASVLYRREQQCGLMPAQNIAQDAKHDQDAGQQECHQLQILPNVQSQFADVVVRSPVIKSTVSLVGAMSNPSDQG